VVADTSTPAAVLDDRRAAGGDRLSVVDYDLPFSFSDKINTGVLASTGEHALMLNDDIEVVTPDLQRVSPGERFYPFEVSPDHVGLDEYDVANQGLVSHHLWPEGDGWRRASVPFRYVWPAELDLMARLAGMTLRHRWGGWRREPFTRDSRSHVSVWQMPRA